MADHRYPAMATGANAPAYAHAPAQPLQPAPRLHWSNWLVLAGGGAMLLALAVVALGLPATVFYDQNGPGEKNNYAGHDPMKLSRSIDKNMKYIRAATGYDHGQYNGLLTSISTSEDVVPAMAQGIKGMDASVREIDMGLSGMLKATRAMSADMAVMAATSSNSAQTMGEVEAHLAEMAATMKLLYGESSELDVALKRIEEQAAAIADKRTGPSRKATHELNAVLPNDVPAPQTSLDAPAGAR